MSDEALTQRRAAAVTDFNAHGQRDDGSRVVNSLSAGLSVLRDTFFNRIHRDVEQAFGMDSMLLPVAAARSETTTNIEIEIYQVVESVVAARDGGYVPTDDLWFLNWLARLRLGDDAANAAATRRLSSYAAQTPNDRRKAFSTRLPQLFPEAGQAPLIIFRLFPLAIAVATSVAFGDLPRADELRKQQVTWLPSISDCHTCHGRLMDNGEKCPQCGNPLWKYDWLTAG